MRDEKLKMRKVEMVRNVRSERGDRILTWMLERNIEFSDAVFAMCSVAHVVLLMLQMPLLRNHEAWTERIFRDEELSSWLHGSLHGQSTEYKNPPETE